MRVVLDTNVMVSAAISKGPSHRIVAAWLRGERFELVICEGLVAEVRSVLAYRPRLRKWISLEAAELYVARPTTAAGIQPDPQPGRALTRDPDDDYVIYLARVHVADLIVSGDADLLEWVDQDPPDVKPKWSPIGDITGESEQSRSTVTVDVSSKPVAGRPGSDAAISTPSRRRRWCCIRWAAAGT